MSEFTTPRTIVFGEDALEYLKEIEGKRALIVTDKLLVELGFVERVEGYLKEAGLEVEVFDKVESDPSVETVMKGVDIAKKQGTDWFVGLGGGSCMDAAKIMWIIYERPDVDMAGISPLEKLGLRRKARLVCIPTTSGTGSDATWVAMITDVREKRKMELASREVVPDISILDPELPLSMPPKLTADTAFDALTHAIEAYVSQWRNDFSDALAIKAVQMIFKYLPRAYKNPEEREAKEKLHYAATMAGLAFSNSQVGLAHAMGHSFGALFNVPHGRSVAVFHPYVIEYSAREAMEKYAEIARAVGVKARKAEEATSDLIEAIKSLMEQTGEPACVKDVGINWEDYERNLDMLVKRTSESTCVIVNPRVPNMKEERMLFVYAFHGKKVDF